MKSNKEYQRMLTSILSKTPSLNGVGHASLIIHPAIRIEANLKSITQIKKEKIIGFQTIQNVLFLHIEIDDNVIILEPKHNVGSAKNYTDIMGKPYNPKLLLGASIFKKENNSPTGLICSTLVAHYYKDYFKKNYPNVSLDSLSPNCLTKYFNIVHKNLRIIKTPAKDDELSIQFTESIINFQSFLYDVISDNNTYSAQLDRFNKLYAETNVSLSKLNSYISNKNRKN